MSVVLSASVRQNLLSLQSTADLLATTQNRLSTGKSVNSALDNPTNFFTAQSLDNRASDINNLLDSIANGVQVLQAANTGLTSLQKLIDSAKSIANQALQTTVGYSTKSNVSTTISGATAADLRGTTSFASATASSNVLYNGTAGGTTAANGTTTLGATIGSFTGTTATTGAGGTTALTGTITLIATNGTTATGLAGVAQPADGDTLTVNGKTITFRSGSAPAATAVTAGSGVSGNLVTDGNGNTTVYLGTAGTPTATVNDLLSAIDLASGVKTVSISAGAATIATSLNQTASSVGASAVTLKSLDGCGSERHRQGRPAQRSWFDDVDRCGQRNRRRRTDHDRGLAGCGDLGRFVAERRRSRHHLQERADPGLDRCSQRSQRLRRRTATC